jgi:hypothetical protein
MAGLFFALFLKQIELLAGLNSCRGVSMVRRAGVGQRAIAGPTQHWFWQGL